MRNMRITFLFSFLFTAMFALGQAIVKPDSTFNGTGRKVFTVGANLDFGDNIALQPDGKIIMTGASMNLGGLVNLGVARLNSDGSFDNTFGTAGISLIDLGGLPSQGGFEPEIVLQADGKIVVNGYGWNGTDEDMFICRLMPNGTLDASFGTGGKVFVGLLSAGMPDQASAITIDASGNIFACGSTRSGGTPFSNDLAIVKLTPSGTLDPTFSEDGKLLLDLSGSADYGFGIATIAGGKIIVTGAAGVPANFFAIRLLSDGSYDATFGNAGKTFVDIMGADLADDCFGMTMTPDGKIVMVGDGYDPATTVFVGAVVRLNANGTLDNTFSTDGIATVASPQTNIFRNIIIRPDGKYLISGSTGVNGNDDYKVVLMNPDGTLDLTFNNTGSYTIDVTGQFNLDSGYGLALQADGKILLSGNTTIAEFINEKYSIVRLSSKAVTAAFSVVNNQVCSGQAVQFNNTSSGSNLTYTWTFEGGTPSTSTQPNPVVMYNSAGVFDVKLVATNGTVVDSIIKNDYINVSTIPAIPATPVGNIAVCGGQTAQYSTSPVPFANSYNWTVTPSVAGTFSGTGVTSTFTASLSYSGAYTITVNATNTCGSSLSSFGLNCTLNATPIAYMISGNNTYCEGTSGTTITLLDSETGVNYQLNIDNQPSGQPVAGTGSAIDWPNQTTQGYYTVMASTATCSQQMAGQIYVSMISVPVQPEIPTGNTLVCNTATSTYSIFNVPLANTYTWVLIPANAGVLTPNSNQVSIAWSSTFSGTANLSVSAANDCGSSPASPSIAITVNNTPIPVVNGLANACLNWSADYTTTATSGSSYAWTVTGGTIVSGAGTASVNVNWHSAGTGTVKVVETSAANCSGTSAVFNVAVDPCVGNDEPKTDAAIHVYPNPAQSFINVKLSEIATSNSQLKLIDALGRQIAVYTLNNGTILIEGIDISNLKSGLYSLLQINDGKVVTQGKLMKK